MVIEICYRFLLYYLYNFLYNWFKNFFVAKYDGNLFFNLLNQIFFISIQSQKMLFLSSIQLLNYLWGNLFCRLKGLNSIFITSFD